MIIYDFNVNILSARIGVVRTDGIEEFTIIGGNSRDGVHFKKSDISC